jgi:protein O-GlcNAc transferase
MGAGRNEIPSPPGGDSLRRPMEEAARLTDTLQSTLAAALRDHQAGQLTTAESGYRTALTLVPEHPYALHLLALLQYQRGDLEGARQLAVRAIGRHSADARFHVNLGNILRAQARPFEAEAAYRAALTRDPAFADAYLALGNLLRERARRDEAIEAYRTGLRLRPDFAELAMNLGVALTEAGRFAEAIASLERAVALREADAEAHYNLANAFAAANRHDEAVREFQRALEIRPGFVPGLYNLGNSLAASGKLREAAEAYEAVVSADPKQAKAWFNLGNAELARNRFARAKEAYSTALALQSDYVGALCGLGRAHLELEQPVEASRCYERALEADPACAKAYAGLGLVLQKAGRFVDAVLSFDRALAFDSALTDVHEMKGASLLGQGRVLQALAAFEKALEISPGSPQSASNRASAMPYLEQYGPGQLLSAHREFANRLAPAASATSASRSLPARLRIGYVSADFRRHSVSYFVEPVLGRHDRGRFEIHCYSSNRADDAVTERLKGLVDRWHDCRELSDAELEVRVRADGIDILVDLSGLTTGNRLGVFARRPAAVQASWLGYPVTTGLEAIDFRLSDAVVDPVGSEAFYAERIVRLPDSYFCYGGPDAEAPVGPLPAASTGVVTFGSFNNLAKVSDGTLRLWSRIVAAVPGSRLMLKSKPLVDEKTRDDVAGRLEAAGIARERLALTGWKVDKLDHLASYGAVDIALDTGPYNGATTTCEALWMGVPVVTFPGRTAASRMGSSILAAAGLDELIASNEEEYVERVVGLAARVEHLAELRAALRERLRRSRLMDAAHFTRALERAYLRMRAGR